MDSSYVPVFLALLAFYVLLDLCRFFHTFLFEVPHKKQLQALHIIAQRLAELNEGFVCAKCVETIEKSERAPSNVQIEVTSCDSHAAPSSNAPPASSSS
jgi:hypothetical protein